MILYNTLIGLSAGTGLILTVWLRKIVLLGSLINRHTWAAAIIAVGLVLSVLGTLMATTWPLTANPPVNIVFGEPAMMFGILLVIAGILLWNAGSVHSFSALRPINLIVSVVGLMMLAFSIAIIRFNLIGGAPEAEPITGRLHSLPWIENTFFGVLYGLVALGALANASIRLDRVTTLAWSIAGYAFIGFSALNCYTHVGLLINLINGTHYRW